MQRRTQHLDRPSVEDTRKRLMRATTSIPFTGGNGLAMIPANKRNPEVLAVTVQPAIPEQAGAVPFLHNRCGRTGG